jgi:GNAT superfamily N-acetyltransferase
VIIRQYKNVRAYYRLGGWYEVALRFSQRALLPPWLFLLTEDVIVRLNCLNERSLSRVPEGYMYSQADGSVIEALLDCSSGFNRVLLRSVFERFFRQGARCFVARRGSQVVGYMWAFEGEYTLTYDNYQRLNLKLGLDGQSVFLGNGFIHETHRLKGLFQHLLAFIIDKWPPGTRFYSAIERTNDRSLSSHLRLGFTESFRVLCISLFSGIRYFRRAAGEGIWRAHDRHEPILL